MTGFGRGERRAGSFMVGVEIRSVNHRHAELRVKVPSLLAALEEGLRRRLAAAVTRGRVDAVVSFGGTPPPAPVEVNHALIDAYLRAAHEVASRHRLPGDLSLESVLSLPGAVSVRGEEGAVTAAQQSAVESAFDDAVEELQRSRAREGRHLAADLDARFRAVGRHRTAIERRAKGTGARFARRLKERLAEIEGGRSVDPARLAQEVALLASRSDITEELVRLEGHLAQARSLLKEGAEPVGKRLDFLLQEMHREANTVNSKSEDLEITRGALAIKAEVEKLREQIQNVE